ncbi:DUF1508 domain-containing protein [Haloarcula sp. S1AR25-5A]|uniref:DUF1508 domain-containing protein n=1 Tax=Haloarcula terrestris TaxID=2950533 RepID=A0AAE4JHM1_9EURY|nr:amphi-Trp domain-containing protein [Haloarcula terrestris]MDS0220236.1 DUF1508 domain-containing protein [Haloarcula terrestris]
MSQDEYETELTGSRADIAAAIHGVADGVLAGAIRLNGGGDSITVDTPDSLSLEIELESDDDEVSLELELEWSAAAVDTAEEQPGSDADVAPDTAASGPADTDRPPETTTDRSAAAGDRESETNADSLPDAAVPAVAATAAAAADASQSLARFEVFRDRREEWRWRLRHHNGNVIATSGEGYTRKHNAWKGLRSVMANSSNAAVVEESTE